MKANILRQETTHAGFFELRRLTVEHDRYAGGTTGPLVREVLHRSDVAAAILYDPATDQVVLTEQYRSGAHLAGVTPWLVDIVAGRIDPNESALEAVGREIREESGLMPHKLEPIGEFLTAPHLSSEKLFLYCATVDATQATGVHGVAHEGEDIRVVVMSRAEAALLQQSRLLSLWAALALNWLAQR
jgi:ADP-ribose pyrophosphatase